MFSKRRSLRRPPVPVTVTKGLVGHMPRIHIHWSHSAYGTVIGEDVLLIGASVVKRGAGIPYFDAQRPTFNIGVGSAASWNPIMFSSYAQFRQRCRVLRMELVGMVPCRWAWTQATQRTINGCEDHNDTTTLPTLLYSVNKKSIGAVC